MGRLWSGPRFVGRLGSGVQISVNFQIILYKIISVGISPGVYLTDSFIGTAIAIAVNVSE